MKFRCFLAGVMIPCMVVSCHDDFARVNCEALGEALIAFDVENSTIHINALLEDLQPVSVSSDPTGHKMNLDIFAERLYSDCSLEAEIGCYACIYTYPALSEMIIRLDSAGTIVSRLLDIGTPDNSVMTLINIHH